MFRCVVCNDNEPQGTIPAERAVCISCLEEQVGELLKEHTCPTVFLANLIPTRVAQFNLAAVLLQVGCKEEAGAMPVSRVLGLIVESILPEAPRTTPTAEQIGQIEKMEEQLAAARAEAHGLEYLNFQQLMGFELLRDHGQDLTTLLALNALPIAHFAGSKEGEIVVAVSDPDQRGIEVLQAEIKEYAKCEMVRLVVSPAYQIKARLQELA